MNRIRSIDNLISEHRVLLVVLFACMMFLLSQISVSADTDDSFVKQSSEVQQSMAVSAMNVKSDIVMNQIRAVKNAEDQKRAVAEQRQAVVDYARQFVGNRYVLGGTSLTNGTDCANFISLIYKNFGYNWGFGNVQVLYERCGGREVSADDLQPGDIITFGEGSGTFSHVALYAGNGRIVHAMDPANGITEINLYRPGTKTVYSGKRITHVKRIIG